MGHIWKFLGENRACYFGSNDVGAKFEMQMKWNARREEECGKDAEEKGFTFG